MKWAGFPGPCFITISNVEDVHLKLGIYTDIILDEWISIKM